MSEKTIINALNFNQEAESIDEINSPTSLKALKLLGYSFVDLKQKTKEQIESEEAKRLEEIPPHRIEEFIELKVQQYEIRRLHRVQHLREMSSTFNSVSKDEFLEKERKKLEKLQEKQRKQIDFLVKNQMQIEDIRRRNEHKKEKLRLLGEKRTEEQRQRQLLNEQQKTQREQKNIELEQQRKDEQRKLLLRYQDKQVQLETKLKGKQQEREAKKQRNNEERKKFEQKIEQTREQQQNEIQQMLHNYQRKEIVNEEKKKQFHEQLQNKFDKRRVASESKRDLITQQKMRHEEEKKEDQQQHLFIKEQSIQNMHFQEELQRKENARLRQEKINKVKEQFQKSLIDLNVKSKQQERFISEMMDKVKQNRSERLIDRQLKIYEHQIRIEETLNNAKRVEKQNEIHRFQILQKISDDNEKLLKIQNEKREMARVKAKIQADHEKEKQSILKEMNTIQRYNESIKLDRSIYSNAQNNLHSNDSFMVSTFNETKKAENAPQSSVVTPRNMVVKQKLSNGNNGYIYENKKQNENIDGSTNNILVLDSLRTTPAHSSYQKSRIRNTNLSSPNFATVKKQQTEPNQLQPIKQITQKPRFKNHSEFDGAKKYQPQFQSNNHSQSFQKKLEEEKREKIIAFLKEHENTLTAVPRSKSMMQNPHLQQFNQSSVIRQRQLEYSQSTRNNNLSNFFNFDLPEEIPKQLRYKSNKLVKSIIELGYVSDVQAHQKIVCQETNLTLSKEVIALSNTILPNGDYLEIEHLDKNKIEAISNELLRSYKKQEEKSHKIHQIYKFLDHK